MAMSGVSDEMRTLHEAHVKLHHTIARIQQQIVDLEGSYFDETPHGNIVRGWDGFIDSKPQRKDATLKRTRSSADSEHLFSSTCFHSSMATEPTLDLVNPSISSGPREPSTRRRSTSSSLATAPTATGMATANGATASSAMKMIKNAVAMAEKKANASGALSGAVLGEDSDGAKGVKPPKKRKRERIESVGADSAEHGNSTGPQPSSPGQRSTSTPAQHSLNAQRTDDEVTGMGEILDVL